MRVAIIGAGPSGIVGLKALLAESGAFTAVKVFERRSTVGGAWNYTPEADTPRKKPVQVPSVDPTRVDPPHISSRVEEGSGTARDGRVGPTWPTPMYDRLNTNIPADLMAYNGMSFADGTELFPRREQVLQYLERYAKDVSDHVSFDTEVVSARKVGDSWRLVHRQFSRTHEVEPEVREEEFDRLMVASGHYETPKLPRISGIETYDRLYPDRVRHSKYYRHPAEYRGKKVLVVGSGPSGADIATQIAGEASLPVYRSTRSPIVTPVIENAAIQDVAEIRAMQAGDGSIVLVDDTVLTGIDAVLFCTGYLYSFSFFARHDDGSDDGDGGNDSAIRRLVSSDGEYLNDLYEQTIYIPDPSLALLAMGMSIVPFPIAEAQSCFVARVWSGKITLPSREFMARAECDRRRVEGGGRMGMVLGHPEDGIYIDRLRRACVDADADNSSGGPGLLPVDWLNTDRLRLRRDGRIIKQAWLRQQAANMTTST